MKKYSEVVSTLMYDYEDLSIDHINEMIGLLPRKITRHLGEVHPDNRMRKFFFEKTNVQVGLNSVLNKNLVISDDYLPLLKIGDRVAVGPNVTIICASGPNNSQLINNPFVKDKLITSKEVIIHDDVWIGCNVVILPGVVIGRGAVIGAGSIVTKDVEEYSLYVGSPAKFVKSI